MPQWTYLCMWLYNRMIYNPLGIYPAMGLLGQMEFLFLDPWGFTKVSSTMVKLIYTPTNSVKVFLFLCICANICCFLTLMITSLTGIRWYFMVVLICISLFLFIYFFIFYCILGLGVHVQSMQYSCIGTHMAVCFVLFFYLAPLGLSILTTGCWF